MVPAGVFMTLWALALVIFAPKHILWVPVGIAMER